MARGLVALAMLAALVGAPWPVSAAVNELSGAHVSPSAGTVTTVFVMRVRYEGGFAASGVTVNLAGATRPMTLEQGSVSAGTWVLATTLPAGTWTPTFAASVLRGPTPTRVGPIVSVSGPSVTTPPTGPSSEATTPRSSASVDQAGDEPASADEPNVAPAATSEVGPAGEPEAETLASPRDEAMTASPGSAPAPGAPRAEASDPGGGTTGNGAAASTTDRSEPASAEAPVAVTTPPDPDGDGDAPAAGDGVGPVRARSGLPVGGDGLIGMVLVIGLIGAAAVALVGTLLLAVGRRRHDPDRTVVAGAAPEATTTEAILNRRTLQRARIRLVDDPIVAALGVDEQMQARRDRRTPRTATDDLPPGDA